MASTQIVMFVGKISDEHKQAITESRTKKGVAPRVIEFDSSESFRRASSLAWMDLSFADIPEDGEVMAMSSDEDTFSARLAVATSRVFEECLGDVRIKQIQTVIYPHDVGNDWMWLREHLSKRVDEYIALYYEDGSGRTRFEHCARVDAHVVL